MHVHMCFNWITVFCIHVNCEVGISNQNEDNQVVEINTTMRVELVVWSRVLVNKDQALVQTRCCQITELCSLQPLRAVFQPAALMADLLLLSFICPQDCWSSARVTTVFYSYLRDFRSRREWFVPNVFHPRRMEANELLGTTVFQPRYNPVSELWTQFF